MATNVSAVRSFPYHTIKHLDNNNNKPNFLWDDSCCCCWLVVLDRRACKCRGAYGSHLQATDYVGHTETDAKVSAQGVYEYIFFCVCICLSIFPCVCVCTSFARGFHTICVPLPPPPPTPQTGVGQHLVYLNYYHP